jgi:diguanylate cyclase (GGDEF)-like protein/PAS domain S-box-containing protein
MFSCLILLALIASTTESFMSVTKLSDFIRTNIEPILVQWEEFARNIPAGERLDTLALRDHAHGILLLIADDIEVEQSAHQQNEKSQGRGPRGAMIGEAERHGSGRVLAGFSINDELAEFRALRATVLRLWISADKTAPQTASKELIRFNEAIDQVLAESVTRYVEDKERHARLFDTMVSSSSDLNFIFDADGRFIYANPSLARLCEISLNDIVGTSLFEMDACAFPALQQALREVLGSKTAQRREVACALSSGEERIYDALLVPVQDRQGKLEAITGVAQDITARKAAEEQIKRSAAYDFLTGLPNRSLFRDRLEQEVKRAGRTGLPLALVFIDLDGFKDVNDRLGHDTGDQLLQQAAQRISSCVRSIDTVARLGGDEFTVILAEVNQIAHVDILAKKMLDELARPFSIQDKQVQISGSIGITFYPRDASNLEDLIRNADQAMYVAKNAGRNRFSFFTIGMRDAAWARLKVIDELRRALPQHQLSVHYQPIVDLVTNRIVKAEALLRWHHPQTGLMLPAEFIGLAEETGLIGEIGEWVLDEAVARAGEWSVRLGTLFQISVNKSLVEFMSKAPAKNWDSHMAVPGRDSITVEITEGVLLNESPSVTEKLDYLQQAGVQLVIDKFGTGYSSMSDLKKFDVNYLKIDQSFVQNLSADSRTIAETIIMMAHKLGLKVIAEGVESAEQRDWLKAAQCDYAQGYFFSAPVSAQDFEKLLDLDDAHGPQLR